jgi:hypothetical protein
MGYQAWLGTKLYGPAPAEGASEIERLRFVRRICVRSLVFYLPIFVVLVVFGSRTVPLVFFCVCLALGGFNIASVTVRIRRRERAERWPL